MTILNKYYIIEVKTNNWQEFDGIEYTEKEANKMLRHLKKSNSQYSFRKKYLREQLDQVLSINTHL